MTTMTMTTKMLLPSPYTMAAPVKLLEAEGLADRYPASESEYRTGVTNGFVSFR